MLKIEERMADLYEAASLREQEYEARVRSNELSYRLTAHSPHELAAFCERRIEEHKAFIAKEDNPQYIQGHKYQIEEDERIMHLAIIEIVISDYKLSLITDGVIKNGVPYSEKAARFVDAYYEDIIDILRENEDFAARKAAFEAASGYKELVALTGFAREEAKKRYPLGAAYLAASEIVSKSGNGGYGKRAQYAIRRLINGTADAQQVMEDCTEWRNDLADIEKHKDDEW